MKTAQSILKETKKGLTPWPKTFSWAALSQLGQNLSKLWTNLASTEWKKWLSRMEATSKTSYLTPSLWSKRMVGIHSSGKEAMRMRSRWWFISGTSKSASCRTICLSMMTGYIYAHSHTSYLLWPFKKFALKLVWKPMHSTNWYLENWSSFMDSEESSKSKYKI